MTKKQFTWIFVSLAVIIVGLLVWYFFFRDDCDPNNDGYTKKGKLSDKCKAKDPADTNTPPPPGEPKWIKDDTFPLKKGMWGSKVRAVQEKLGIYVDDKFGTDTEEAVYARFKENTVSQPNYDSLVNPVVIAGGANFTQLKANLPGETSFNGGVSFNKQGQNKNYRFDFYASNGRFIVNTFGTDDAIKRGTYSNGGKKMVVDGGNTYDGNVVDNMAKIINDIGG